MEVKGLGLKAGRIWWCSHSGIKTDEGVLMMAKNKEGWRNRKLNSERTESRRLFDHFEHARCSSENEMVSGSPSIFSMFVFKGSWVSILSKMWKTVYPCHINPSYTTRNNGDTSYTYRQELVFAYEQTLQGSKCWKVRTKSKGRRHRKEQKCM